MTSAYRAFAALVKVSTVFLNYLFVEHSQMLLYV